MVIGAIVVSIITVASVVLTLKIKSIIARLIISVAVAYLSAYLLYWGIAMVNSNNSEYSSWSGLIVNLWFQIGAVVGLFAIGISALIKWAGNKSAS